MIAIQIIGDILAAHPSLLNKPLSSVEQGDAVQEQEHALHKPIHKLFSKSLKSQSAAVQSTACAALCKLMLSAPSTAHSTSGVSSSILNMEELLRLLVVAYFDPETASNTGLRQSLSYFIPVYCHSRKENMESMGSVSLTVLSWYMSLKDEMDVDGEDEAESEMVSVNVVLAHLADWTDGRKLAMARMGAFDASDDIEADTDVHVELAERVLEKMLGVSSRMLSSFQAPYVNSTNRYPHNRRRTKILHLTPRQTLHQRRMLARTPPKRRHPRRRSHRRQDRDGRHNSEHPPQIADCDRKVHSRYSRPQSQQCGISGAVARPFGSRRS